jgi:amino-acid N-acetyltransferase
MIRYKINMDGKQNNIDKYLEISKKSLIRVQYSCGGNGTCINETADVPIVPENIRTFNTISYRAATENDVENIIKLLKENDLPTNDLTTGKRIFITAHAGDSLVGCVAVEIYPDNGLLRSLAVADNFRNAEIGTKLVTQAEILAVQQELNSLFLLTTTAAGFFSKNNWKTIDRTEVPEEIRTSSEFAALCPSSSICMFKKLKCTD